MNSLPASALSNSVLKSFIVGLLLVAQQCPYFVIPSLSISIIVPFAVTEVLVTKTVLVVILLIRAISSFLHESKKSYKKIKKKNNFQNETKNNEFNNDLKWILEKINYIDKKVEKLYIMKKNKKNNKPIIIENKNNKDDILTALRNKMLNN